MRVEQISIERFEEYVNVAAVAFTFDKEGYEAHYKAVEEMKQSGAPTYTWAAIDDDDKIMAGMKLLPYVTRIGDKWVKLCGIGGVATLPEYRRSGAIREIFRVGFEYMRKEGYVLSGLYPFLHAFYRKFGYELCYTPTVQTVPLTEFAAFPQPERVRMVVDPADSAEARQIYELFSARYNLSMQRDDKHWKRVWGGDAYTERVYRYLIYDESGSACAYIVFAYEFRDNANRIIVRELAYVDSKAMRMALGFLSKFYPHYRTARVVFPGDVNFAALTQNPYELSEDVSRTYMIRIVDVPAALSAMRFPEDDGSFVIDVADDFIPYNAGLYRVSFSDEVGSVERCEASVPADIRLDVRTLAQLVTGLIDIPGASFRPDFEQLSANTAPNKLFKKYNQYVADHY